MCTCRVLENQRVSNRDVSLIDGLKRDQGRSDIRRRVVIGAPQQPAATDQRDGDCRTYPTAKARGANSVAIAQEFRLAPKVGITAHCSILSATMNNGGMGNTTTDVNVGLYASLIMILLTVGVAVLLTSFYRRYKRANNRTDDNN